VVWKAKSAASGAAISTRSRRLAIYIAHSPPERATLCADGLLRWRL